MAEDCSIKELVEHINSSARWYPIEDKVIECVAPSVLPEIQDDPIPVTVVTYYPFCDCGEPVLLEKVLMSKELTIYGYGYMDTCYECGVVSSD